MFDLKKAHGSVSIGSLGRLALQQHVYFWQRKPNFLAHVFKNGEEGKTMCCKSSTTRQIQDESAAQMLLDSEQEKQHCDHRQSIFNKQSAINTQNDYNFRNINKILKKNKNNQFHLKQGEIFFLLNISDNWYEFIFFIRLSAVSVQMESKRNTRC